MDVKMMRDSMRSYEDLFFTVETNFLLTILEPTRLLSIKSSQIFLWKLDSRVNCASWVLKIAIFRLYCHIKLTLRHMPIFEWQDTLSYENGSGKWNGGKIFFVRCCNLFSRTNSCPYKRHFSLILFLYSL